MTATVDTTGVPPAQQSVLRRVAPVLGVGAGVGLASLALHLRDPNVQGSWGFCPTALLGLACPFCGSLRAVHHLTDVDVAAAASSNLVLVAAVPVAAALWFLALGRAVRGRPLLPRVPAALWWVVGALLLVFTVLRNLPVAPFDWLAP